jgi:lipopolysaccharide/colanic/teichoic acid biosynthesis glycosyltransferase/NDP-sugar pyrophosphorylase family protein
MNAYPSLLFPVLDGKPLLHHLLNQLRAHGIREVAVALSADGGRGDRLLDALARLQPADMTVHWHVDGGNRGAAGAIKELEGLLSSGPALVVHPSIWLDGFELDAMWREHRERGSTVTMLLESTARSRGDLHSVDLDADGVVRRYSNIHASREKRSSLRPAGVYFMEPDIFSFVESGRYVDLAEQLIGWLNEDGYLVRGYMPSRPLKRFEDAAQYFSLNRQLMLQWWSDLDWERQGSTAAPDGIQVMEGARVAKGALIVGPAVIGRGSVIEEGARIIGPALICDGTSVGRGALVRDSVIWRGSSIGEGASVEYSLLTEQCALQPAHRVLGALVEDAGASVGELTPDSEVRLPSGAEAQAGPAGGGSAARARSRFLYFASKRALDIVVPLTLLPVLIPVLLLTAIAIKLDSPGPVFFRQVRCGRSGREFAIWKFRTMVLNAEELYAKALANNEVKGPMLKLKKDPRTTRIGEFLRRTSIDELPQLWNVLRGDMTLVGPRPLAMREMVWCPRWRDLRLRVKPGLTGLWQVSSRGAFSFDGWIEHDIRYVKQQSLGLDLQILLKTVLVLWKRPNAA